MAQSTSSTGNEPLIELKHVDKHYGGLTSSTTSISRSTAARSSL